MTPAWRRSAACRRRCAVRAWLALAIAGWGAVFLFPQTTLCLLLAALLLEIARDVAAFSRSWRRP